MERHSQIHHVLTEKKSVFKRGVLEEPTVLITSAWCLQKLEIDCQ
jgi:hypothetical protein